MFKEKTMKGDKNALNTATSHWLILLTVLEYGNIIYLYLILVPSLKKGHTGNPGYSELGYRSVARWC